MEKQGMDRRKRAFWIGLLILLLPFVFADEGEPAAEVNGAALEMHGSSPADQPVVSNPPVVRIESSTANPTVKNPWWVYVLVNHPYPHEVTIEPPHFPNSIVLERVRADTRFVVPDSSDGSMRQGERWTRVEYLFTPIRADTFSLSPFGVLTPAGRAYSTVMNVSIRQETARYEPRLRWLGQAPVVSPGERAELFLELVNWDPYKNPPVGIFQGKAPHNTIVNESLPRPAGEGPYRYTINVIPLNESSVLLESFSFRSDIYVLNIPHINVQVRSVRREAVPKEEIILNETLTVPGGTTPFPQTREKVFFLFQGEYDRIIGRALALWNEGRRAEALAEIRRNERDSFSGHLLVYLRREMEKEMNLDFTVNERWRPLKIPLASFVIFFIVIVFVALFLLFLRKPFLDINFSGRNGSINVIILVIAIGLAMILLEERLGNFPVSMSPDNTAILRSTQSYRVPDLRG
jgi:hypothetical protein